MKRLFKRFEKETGLVSASLKKMSGYVEPEPPPLKWYERLINFLIGLFVRRSAVRPAWIPGSYGELSVAFNEWLTTLWNYNRAMKIGKRHKQACPFGARINKHIIRKWALEYEQVFS